MPMTAVVFASDNFCIWDEEEFINSMMEDLNFKINEELFNVAGQYMMDSAFQKSISRQRDEKWKSDDDDVFEASLTGGCNIRLPLYGNSDLPKINEHLSEVAVEVKRTGRELGYFIRNIPGDNNVSARRMGKVAVQSVPTLRASTVIHDPSIVSINKEIALSSFSLISSWYTTDESTILTVTSQEGNASFLLPQRSTFHVGTVENVNIFASLNDHVFDFILMDPPWKNCSVRRKNSYQMNEDALSGLFIPQLLANNGLVAIWVTNSPHVHALVLDLLSQWGLVQTGILYWIKTTSGGRPIVPFSLIHHKLPYEAVIFAVRPEEKETMELEGKLPPMEFVIASVPMCVHSRKPSILPFLKELMPSFRPTFPIELFARSLIPGCTSVGFEPLLLQHSAFFTKCQS